MIDIASYGVREVVLEDERFVLYRARSGGDAEVLLKVAREGATPDDLSAFSSDFLAARRCQVPAIPRPIRIDTMRTGATFQVREHVPGQPLSLWVSGERPRPHLGEAMRIALLIVSALEPLHARGFVHCDISPRNLLYDAEGRAIYFADCTWARGGGVAPRRTMGRLTPYLAPEQLLDEPRSIDGRADLYAVGIILHQLITGQLPPDDGGALAVEAIPGSLQAILARLLEPSVERRYRTAAAAKKDLARCLEGWRSQAVIPDVAPSVEERGEVVVFPDEPYGRSEVRQILSEALFEAAAGNPTLILLTGDGGGGKSTILADLRRTALAEGAIVLGGGWGLFDRDVPFRGLTPVCEQLVEWLSTMDEPSRRQRIEELRGALGESCGVVTEAFPVLESVLGIHPRPAVVGTVERQNRLTYCFTTLLAALGRPGSPLVLLLEDAHWSDEASLSVLHRLPGRAAPRHLLCVSTVRTGADGADDAFAADLESVCLSRGQTVRVVAVTPFEQADTESFLSAALGVRSEETRGLATVLTEMSDGNPLALRELLAEIAAQGLIRFSRDEGRWTWRAQEIQQCYVPEDVARIIASRLSSLPPAALEVLQAAACVAARFDVAAVVRLLERSPGQIVDALNRCHQAGFIIPVAVSGPGPGDGNTVFEFRHERVQSAAYASLEAAVQERFHAARGTALRAAYEETQRADLLFEALTHLNRSHALRGGGEDQALARSNYAAALLAKQSMAHSVAAQLLNHMEAQLPRDIWTWDPALAFECALLRAECAYLSKDTDRAVATYAELLGQVSEPARRITILMARSQMLTNLGRFRESIADGVACLRLLGHNLRVDPRRIHTVLPLLRMMRLHRRLPPPDAAMPLADVDAKTAQIMAVLAELWGPAFWVNENLTGLVVFAMVRLSLTRGNIGASAVGYGSYGVFLATAMKKERMGRQVCRLGVEVAERTNSHLYLGRARFMYEAFFGPYDRALGTAPDAFREIATACLRAGDYSYAGAAANMFLYYLAVVGIPLSDFGLQAREMIGAARQTEQSRTLLTVEILQRWIAVLEGREDHTPPRFADALEGPHQRGSENEQGVYHLFEISLCYLLEDYKDAEPHIAFMPGNKMCAGYFAAYFAFFSALVIAKQIEAEPSRKRGWAQFRRHHRVVKKQAERQPQNFRHKSMLLAAVEADSQGRTTQAVSLFEAAIADARDNGFIQNAAIAAELLAEHFLRQGSPSAADPHFRNARLWYHQWGCLRKVGSIDRRLALWAPRRDTPHSGASEVASAWARDVRPVLEASRALSAETEPAQLTERLMSSILEHTGATRVVLLTREGSTPTVACERHYPPREDGPKVERPADDLPEAVINYVDRLGRPVRLTAGPGHELFGRDPYMKVHGGRTLLCVPLMHMRKKLGVVFIEKEGATPLRQSDLVTAEILAGQAAATLSSAREQSARVTALQNQMHPHFLFNALNGIAELTAADPMRAESAVLGLAALYRSILDTSNRRAISLAREFEIIESYLALEKLRFGSRLDYRFDVQGDITRPLLPPLVLQPLVENSVNHGIARKVAGGTVTITALVNAERVHVRISDDGAGWELGGSGLGAGTGLKSTRRRLELFFGGEYELTIGSKDGVSLDLFFPVRIDEQGP